VLHIADPAERRLVAAADAVIRAVTVLRRRRSAQPAAGLRRVLVLRLERIGDLMMSLPALHALGTLAPHASIDLVTGSWNAPLARLIPGIGRVETLDANWLSRGDGGRGMAALMQHARGWRPRRYDLAINLEGDIRSNLLLALSGAARTAGFGMAGGGALLDDDVAFDPAAHTATNGVRLVTAAVGGAWIDPVPRPGSAREVASALPRDPLALPDSARAGASALLAAAAGKAGPLVGIQVGAGRAIKEWPAARMAGAANRLAAAFGATIVLTGARADRAAADAIRTGLAPSVSVIDLVGQPDLVTLAAVMSRLDLLITPDTGPMHLAAVLDTPLVAIFGPSSPERWGPLSSRCRIVRVDLWCSPCNRIRRPPERCVGHTPDCLEAIQVDDVVRAAADLLARARPPAGGPA